MKFNLVIMALFFPSNNGPFKAMTPPKMPKHLPAGGEKEGNSCFVWLAFTALLHLLNCLCQNPQVFRFSPLRCPSILLGQKWGVTGWLHRCWLGSTHYNKKLIRALCLYKNTYTKTYQCFHMIFFTFRSHTGLSA